MITSFNRYNELYLFYGFVLLSLVFSIAGVILEKPMLAIIPLGLILGIIGLYKFRMLYLYIFFFLPFTVEIYLPNGLGIDLPTEPLLILCTGIFLFIVLANTERISAKYMLHPISLLLIAHVFWIGFATLYSTHFIVSLKLFVAKFWYLIPFFVMPIWYVKNKATCLKIIQLVLVALFIACLYVWVHHGLNGFRFDEINKAVSPVFKNHVSYSFVLMFSLPLLWVYIRHKKLTKFNKNLLKLFFVFLLVSLYLSFTRAAYIGVVLGLVAYVIIKFKLLKYALIAAVIVMVSGALYVTHENKYVDFAPNFEKTVTHYKFDNLIEATTKGEDISTMERAYRWVAGYEMLKQKPWIGFGPGTFYFTYRAYTQTQFKTYVSHNPDKSGIHNYYLMTLVEQGIIGLLIFVSFCLFTLWRGEELYHRLSTSFQKDLVMAALLILIMAMAVLLINDMVEAIKFGSFFFISIAIILRIDIATRGKRTAS